MRRIRTTDFKSSSPHTKSHAGRRRKQVSLPDRKEGKWVNHPRANLWASLQSSCLVEDSEREWSKKCKHETVWKAKRLSHQMTESEDRIGFLRKLREGLGSAHPAK